MPLHVKIGPVSDRFWLSSPILTRRFPNARIIWNYGNCNWQFMRCIESGPWHISCRCRCAASPDTSGWFRWHGSVGMLTTHIHNKYISREFLFQSMPCEGNDPKVNFAHQNWSEMLLIEGNSIGILVSSATCRQWGIRMIYIQMYTPSGRVVGTVDTKLTDFLFNMTVVSCAITQQQLGMKL